MAEESGNNGSKQSFDIKSLDLLEKAGDFHWMLQIVAVALFLDCALLVAKGSNLLNYTWAQFTFANEVPLLLVTALTYSVLVSAVIPLIGGFVGIGIRYFYDRFLYLHLRDKDASKRWNNQVSYYELKEHADRTQSTYVKGVYEAWEGAQIKIETQKIKLERASFRMLTLIAAEFYLSTPEKPSTLLDISTHFSNDAFGFPVVCTIGLLLYLCCASWCRDSYQTKWITYAPLYDQIIEKQEADKKRMEDFANESYQRMRIRRNFD